MPDPVLTALAFLAVIAQARSTAPPDSADSTGWDAPRARAIAAHAIEARRDLVADSGLHAYSARAEGHVRFLLDVGSGGDGGERLVRTDQIALHIFWEAPSRSLQMIVGRRHDEDLPSSIRYHIDHLTVALEDYQNSIRFGEGAEVRGVLHPAAPGALDYYEYRLADSLGIRIGTALHWVYRLDVRPAHPASPGVVGSLYVDRSDGAIARMSFTFTPSSYVDPRLAGIDVDVVSGLHGGRFWLPASQDIEIRRVTRWMDFPIAGIIRSHLDVFGYTLNPASKADLPAGNRVVTLPDSALTRYDDWRHPLHYDDNGANPLTLQQVRRSATRMARRRLAAVASGVRPALDNASQGARIRRAEGFLLGGGVSFSPAPAYSVSAWAGYPFGRRQPELEAEVAHSLGEDWRLSLQGQLNGFTDIGPFPAAAGAVSSLAFLTYGRDFTDPYFRDGARLGLDGSWAGGSLRISAGTESQEAANFLASGPSGGPVRPLRPIEEGRLTSLRIAYRRELGRASGASWEGRLSVEAASSGLGDFGFTRWLAELEGEGEQTRLSLHWRSEIALAAASGTLPPQRLVLLGGRGTVPGYDFRGWGGDRAAFAHASLSRAVLAPWLAVRALAAAGWVGVDDAGRTAAERMGVGATGGIRSSVGAGLGVFYDLVHLDLARGLDRGRWEWMVSVDSRFWPIL